MKKTILGLLCLAAVACGDGVKRTDGGAVVTAENGERVRLEAVTERIVRVSAVPGGRFSERGSLAVLPAAGRPEFEVESDERCVRLTTSALRVEVDRADGRTTFYDADGNELLAEDRREFTPVEADGDRGYSVRQVFLSPDDEAFYGLGQHQSDEFNYKGKNETLYQYNTKVSVPFIVSDRGYGILWDNCSLTRWGDPRDYLQLDEAFEKSDLTARYQARDGFRLERTEPRLDYSDLDKVDAFPAEMLPRFYGSRIVWEGDLTPRESGIHRFILYYAGYTTLYVDGREVVPEHWRTAWNPNSVKFELEMRAGEPRRVKIEWRPDGGVSYLSLKALTPVAEEEQAKQSWWSELGDQTDYYFVYGGTPDGVISGYRTLTGKSQIMPKWAMGYWQSRERYKTQREIVETVAEHRRRHIGLDNIVMDWSHWREDAWGSHEFDPARFEDPKAMVDSIHAMNARFMVSVWPKFYCTTDHYKELDAIGAIYRRAVQDSVRDWIGAGYMGSFYDAYDPEARRLFWHQMSEHYLPLGVDAWWMDASEPDILSNASLEYRKALSGPTYLGSSTRYLNAYALMNAQAIYEGQRGERPDQRVFLLTRSGFAGLQRYSTATWSGDIGTCWEDMKAQISAGLNFAMSGIPYWTQDIGGFCVQRKFERAREGSQALDEWRELNARWHQWGVFSPLYRAHGQYPYREIYHIAPEKHPAYRSILCHNRLRYRLMPYIYTLASRTWFDDYTIMRPLVMDFPSDARVKNISDQFMFGDALMVCPVYEYKARSREVYLPAGGWYDYRTNAYVEGGRTIEAEAPYEYSPLYVRAGRIVPTGRDIEYTSQEQDGALTLTVYAGADARFSLYEDEGVNYNYEKGLYSRIPMEWNEAAGTFAIGARTGGFEGMIAERPVEVRIVSPTGIRSFAGRYDGTELTFRTK
ncbi:MAG: DUF5110 domain-containing protein [Alistipes sp.]|nr:DUF5110 domain-containing protein [Alistipes senegalensis]MCM1250989.1 DUF5110 domain-containing protein [Alistipes sp.]